MNASQKKGKRVGVWIRVSTEDQAIGESPQHHEYRARQYAEFQGWTVIEVYDLAGVSGKSVWEHPECQRMLRDLKRGHIQGLIFSKLARLARNTRELLDFADVFEEHKAALVSIEEKIDTSTPAGLLFYTMLGAIAQWEREEITARVHSSIKVRAKLGKPLSGGAPYGYKWEDKKLVQVPSEAAVRRLAFEYFLEHKRKGVVARLLNGKGHRTRHGKEFRDMHVKRMLECPSAIGVYRTNTHKGNGNGKGWQRKPESEWGSSPCPAIVSEDVFRRVNEILEQQFKPTAKPGKKPTHVFAGVVRCACGGKMYVYTRSPNYTCTRCKNKIGARALDELFLDCIKDTLADSGQIAEQIKAAKSKIALRSGEIAAARKELDEVKAEMRKVYDLYIAGGVDVEGFKAINKPLEQRLNGLTESLARLEGEVSARQVNDLSVDAIRQEARSLSKAWSGLDADGKQRIVSMLCKEIVVPDKDPEAPIELTLTHAPPRDTSAHIPSPHKAPSKPRDSRNNPGDSDHPSQPPSGEVSDSTSNCLKAPQSLVHSTQNPATTHYQRDAIRRCAESCRADREW
ncbi:MAG: recombinase family protein [Verrucomicrobiaceae bacterium]|nr:recombinase family protein [Verrucomicrobiaceae bacterium]